MARLVREGARTICFIKSRKAVELLSRLIADDLRESDPQLAALVAPYRAGYTPQQRRELEGRLVRGELRAVITTDALDIHLNNAHLFGRAISGDITFGVTSASLFPPLHA